MVFRIAFLALHSRHLVKSAANESKKSGLTVSPAVVRCVWQRQDMETINKWLKVPAASVRFDGHAFNAIGDQEMPRAGPFRVCA
jgi:hypothetical protein